MDSLKEFNISNVETSTLNELLPRQLRLNSKAFVNLLEDYYRFLNQKDNPSYVIQRIIDEHDLDKVVDNLYLDKIKYEIARAVPTSQYVQNTFLLKRIIDSYGIRGNDESVLYFFRIFFNENVTIFNPWEQVLIPSQGNWKKTVLMRVVLYCGDEDLLIGKNLIQKDRYENIVAKTKIIKVNKKIFYNNIYFDLEIEDSESIGEFSPIYEVFTSDGLCRGNVIRVLNDVKIKNGGNNYLAGDKIYVGKFPDISFTVIANRVDNDGSIISISINDIGISSTIEYKRDVKNDPLLINNLSKVYISGLLTKNSNDKYTIFTEAEIQNEFEISTAELQIDLELYVNKTIIATGVLSSSQLILQNIYIRYNNTILSDYDFYDSSNLIEYSSDFKSIESVVVRSNTHTSFDEDAEFLFSFNTKTSQIGYYQNEKGRPSGFSVLQDSFYYQVFSYEIQSTLSIDKWESSLYELIHPAGFKLFGNIYAFGIAEFLAVFDLLIAIDEEYEPKGFEITEYLGLSGSISLLAQNYGGVTDEDLDGPYFLEDYTTTISFFNTIEYNPEINTLQYVDNGTIYNFVYSISTSAQVDGTEFNQYGEDSGYPDSWSESVFGKVYTLINDIPEVNTARQVSTQATATSRR